MTIKNSYSVGAGTCQSEKERVR